MQRTENRPHVANNGGNAEWYTPKEYIDAAVEVMGGIDLDPASCEIANRMVGAEVYYTADDSGLDKRWSGRVYMNPPYSRYLVSQFCYKLTCSVLEGDVSEAIVLVNNATETSWFWNLYTVASAVVFPSERVRFYGPEGQTARPLQGQAVIYIGENTEKFLEVFSRFGWGCIIHRIEVAS
jgi:ParB family chromosome partitioning protein